MLKYDLDKIRLLKTFGGLIDPCQKFSSNEIFIYYLTKYNISSAPYSSFHQICNNSVHCLEATHIIDKKNSPYSNCNLDIFGNTIMAKYTWIKSLQYCKWNKVSQEKQIVFNRLYQTAINNIKKCDPSCVIQESSLNEMTNYKIYEIIRPFIIIILCTIGGSVFCLTIICYMAGNNDSKIKKLKNMIWKDKNKVKMKQPFLYSTAPPHPLYPNYENM